MDFDRAGVENQKETAKLVRLQIVQTLCQRGAFVALLASFVSLHGAPSEPAPPAGGPATRPAPGTPSQPGPTKGAKQPGAKMPAGVGEPPGEPAPGEAAPKSEAESPELPPSPATSACSIRYQERDFALSEPWELHVDRGGAGSYAAVRDRSWSRAKLPFLFSKLPETKQHVGHVWLRCGIQVDGEVAEMTALYLGLVMDVDEVFFNGTRIGGTGSFQPLRVDIEKERLYSIPKKLWRRGENLVVVHVYGTRGRSGFTRAPQIVDEGQTARRLHSADTPAIVLSCIYVLVSLFFGLFAVFFWHRKENLYFALFSLSLGLYYLIRTRVRYEIFSDFHLSYKAELILLILAPVWFLNFLLRLIRVKTPTVAIAWQAYYGLLVVFALLAGKPVEWDNVIVANLGGLAVFIPLMLWLFKTHYAQNRSQLRYLLLGLVPVLPALINDMLVAGGLYNGPRFVVYALLVFLTFVALQLADSVLELYRNLQEQENELRQLEKRKTSSIFNISSEFRTIFEGLKGVISGMENGKSTGARRASTDRKRLNQELLRLNNFLTDSNLLPLLESGDYVKRRVRFSVRKMAEGVVEKALLITGSPSRRVQSDLPAEDLEMTGDPDLISSAMLHLVENALLYTQGQVELSVEKDGNHLVVMVRDEGPGLGEDQKSLVFQKFVRGVEESSDIPGTGVGLHIVQLIARHLDGSLRLESGGGFFSTFVLSIPMTTEQRAA